MVPVTRSQTARSRLSSTGASPSPIPSNSNIGGNEPPLYTVDLSLPPHTRYRQICHDYAHNLQAIIPLYDSILALTPFPRVFKYLARHFLKRVHSSEETKEIRGIAKETGIDIHLVVAYNTFLDLFPGCVSGGVMVRGDNGGRMMLHFRGLDWYMEELRGLFIRVEYVRDGEVVARAVTYAGYIGALTGVRQGLSLSFNSRARISSSVTFAQKLHPALLLLGFRPSLSSKLRHILLRPGPPPTLSELATTFPSSPSSPGYVTFCSPERVLVMEKDLTTAVIHSSLDFLAVTNHDQEVEEWDPELREEALRKHGPESTGLRSILEDSTERRECISNMFRATALKNTPRIDDVKTWLTTRPVLNDMTHFSCIMDPGLPGGGLAWVHAYEFPVSMDEESDESSTFGCDEEPDDD